MPPETPFRSQSDALCWLQGARAAESALQAKIEPLEDALIQGYQDAHDPDEAWKGVDEETWEEGSKGTQKDLWRLSARLEALREQMRACVRDFGRAA